jgi:hypothetical protein
MSVQLTPSHAHFLHNCCYFRSLLAADGRLLGYSAAAKQPESEDVTRLVGDSAAFAFREYASVATPASLGILLWETDVSVQLNILCPPLRTCYYTHCPTFLQSHRIGMAPIGSRFLLVCVGRSSGPAVVELGALRLLLEAGRRDLCEPLERVGMAGAPLLRGDSTGSDLFSAGLSPPPGPPGSSAAAPTALHPAAARASDSPGFGFLSAADR